MVLLNSVSWAFDVGWYIEIVLHIGFVQEWLTDFEAMGSSSSVDSEHVELIELVHELIGFESAILRGWLLLEAEVALSEVTSSEHSPE